jgi:hypothetical protein
MNRLNGRFFYKINSMFSMCHKITISRNGKEINLFTNKIIHLPVSEINIVSSTSNLLDTATITLPETVLNEVIDYRKVILIGDYIVIQLGYDGRLETEFEGYIDRFSLEDGTFKVHCIDALYLFKKNVKDVELKSITLKQIAQHIVDQIDKSFKVVCDFNIPYEKFVIHNATGLDVLKKLQEETLTDIYFRTDKKELHIRPAFTEKSGDVIYSMQRNIESSSLVYKYAKDNKIQITIEGTDSKGKVFRVVRGDTGGEAQAIKAGTMSQSALETIVDNAYNKRNADRYEGSFTAWLIPFVKSSYSAKIIDSDYPDKTTVHYVQTVETNFSESGGVRTITLGIRLG